MIIKFFKTHLFIPNEYVNTIHDIDFNKLYEKGTRLILVDLDNTLISYDEKLPTDKIIDLFKQWEHYGFEVVIISNNLKARVSYFTETLGVNYIYSASKPRAIGFKKAEKLTKRNYLKEEICLIGDQIMTDVWGGNCRGYYTVLVNPIKAKTEKWYTKFNRKIEGHKLRNIEKKYNDKYISLKLNEKK